MGSPHKISLMAKGNVLITGGAGFIGSHLTDHLLTQGYNVSIIDNLLPQVHQHAQKDSKGWPTYVNKECKRIKGNILDINTMRKALKNQDYLIHLAGSVGVGQSMTNILEYTINNDVGGATILQVISEGKTSIKKMAVASSISIYGEGACKKPSTGEIIYPQHRSSKQLMQKRWENEDENGEILVPVPTKESKPLFPGSIYAVNKIVHEYDFLIMGKSLGIPTAAMRMFNVYGTRQALSNPYTGVAAIFISRLKNNKPPTIFEDGGQKRNFVHVKDIVRAYSAFLKSDKNSYEVFNVGSDEVVSISELAVKIAKQMNKKIEPTISQQYRYGDIRHCYPDLTKIKKYFNWKPQITLAQGLPDLVEWSESQLAIDYSKQSLDALRTRGLLT